MITARISRNWQENRPMYIEIARSLKHMKGKKYFSETGEDSILLSYLGTEKGSFLDIGAGHPIIGSNTYALYIRGWKGTAIEPIGSYRQIWRFIRKRDTFIKAVVSEQEGTKTFYEFQNPLLSTLDESVARFHEEKGKKFETYKVDSIKLSNLLPNNLSSKESFLLNIDVEGAEIDVLKGNDFLQKRPRFIDIEAW